MYECKITMRFMHFFNSFHFIPMLVHNVYKSVYCTYLVLYIYEYANHKLKNFDTNYKIIYYHDEE